MVAAGGEGEGEGEKNRDGLCSGNARDGSLGAGPPVWSRSGLGRAGEHGGGLAVERPRREHAVEVVTIE